MTKNSKLINKQTKIIEIQHFLGTIGREWHNVSQLLLSSQAANSYFDRLKSQKR